MKLFRLFVLHAIFVLALSAGAFAQDFPYDVYDPRTLSELADLQKDATSMDYGPSKKHIVVNAKPFYSAVRVTFIGTAKPLTTEEKEYLKIWQGTLGYDEKVLALFENKYLFKECDKEYWIVVQKPVAAFFPKELKTGDMVTLYLMFPGSTKFKPTDPWNHLFLVNEFRKY